MATVQRTAKDSFMMWKLKSLAVQLMIEKEDNEAELKIIHKHSLGQEPSFMNTTVRQLVVSYKYESHVGLRKSGTMCFNPCCDLCR